MMPEINMPNLIEGAPDATIRMNGIIGRDTGNRGRVVGPAYPPRAMRVEQAADYLSMSRSMFLKLVGEGKMPKPIKIGAMTTWDRHDIDDAFEDLKRGDGSPSENSVHKRLRELADERKGKKS
jgi:predicted DNA-binding transcriptional regulator AlpA